METGKYCLCGCREDDHEWILTKSEYSIGKCYHCWDCNHFIETDEDYSYYEDPFEELECL